jgi:glutaredoxin
MWFQAPKRKPRIDFISKTECPLCDEALEILNHIQKTIPCRVRLKKIDDDEALFEAHKYEVPVIFIDQVKRFFGKVNRRSLERAIKIASRKSGN